MPCCKEHFKHQARETTMVFTMVTNVWKCICSKIKQRHPEEKKSHRGVDCVCVNSDKIISLRISVFLSGREHYWLMLQEGMKTIPDKLQCKDHPRESCDVRVVFHLLKSFQVPSLSHWLNYKIAKSKTFLPLINHVTSALGPPWDMPCSSLQAS